MNSPAIWQLSETRREGQRAFVRRATWQGCCIASHSLGLSPRTAKIISFASLQAGFAKGIWIPGVQFHHVGSLNQGRAGTVDVPSSKMDYEYSSLTVRDASINFCAYLFCCVWIE